ncbi:hypothetical protein GCM10011357_38190 [Lacimicrobium alkaliphilum]|uniref:Uncharacterized protein n=1 Tax=Lacimicrobium alkaliphilum TaxID=1526571 RepID=A0ABQ1RW73_9ALTE|nr:hypothetical protein GCM10011357_38190 [Lacimicrobium alkaliphilum]
MLNVAQELGIKAAVAGREIDRIITNITRFSEQLIREVEATDNYDAKPEELRMLRKIKNLAISEFTKQIQQ